MSALNQSPILDIGTSLVEAELRVRAGRDEPGAAAGRSCAWCLLGCHFHHLEVNVNANIHLGVHVNTDANANDNTMYVHQVLRLTFVMCYASYYVAKSLCFECQVFPYVAAHASPQALS